MCLITHTFAITLLLKTLMTLNIMKTTLIHDLGKRYEAHLESGVILKSDVDVYPRFNHFKNFVLEHVLEEYMDEVVFSPTVTVKRLSKKTNKQLSEEAKTAKGLHLELIQNILSSRSSVADLAPSFTMEEAEEIQEQQRVNIDRWIDFEEVSSGLPMCGRIVGIVLDRRVPMVLYRIHINGDPKRIKHKSVRSDDIDFNDIRTAAWVEAQERAELEAQQAKEAQAAKREADKEQARKIREEARRLREEAKKEAREQARVEREEARRIKKEAEEQAKAKARAEREEARRVKREEKEAQQAARAQERAEAAQRKAELAAAKAAAAAKVAAEAAKAAAAAQKLKAREATRKAAEAKKAAAKAAAKKPAAKKPAAKKPAAKKPAAKKPAAKKPAAKKPAAKKPAAKTIKPTADEATK